VRPIVVPDAPWATAEHVDHHAADEVDLTVVEPATTMGHHQQLPMHLHSNPEAHKWGTIDARRCVSSAGEKKWIERKEIGVFPSFCCCCLCCYCWYCCCGCCLAEPRNFALIFIYWPHATYAQFLLNFNLIIFYSNYSSCFAFDVANHYVARHTTQVSMFKVDWKKLGQHFVRAARRKQH